MFTDLMHALRDLHLRMLIELGEAGQDAHERFLNNIVDRIQQPVLQWKDRELCTQKFPQRPNKQAGQWDDEADR